MIAQAVLLWIGGCSLLTLIAFARDKAAARRGARRTPEARLLALALLGGGPGALCGMMLWRHKTRRLVFWLAAWLGCALGAAAWWAAR